jgi:hypothetical protein
MLLTSMALATCFELVGPKYYYLPKELCVDSLTLNIEQGVLYIDSSSMPESMAADMVRKNEDYYRFTASKQIIDLSEGTCSDYTSGTLNLKGLADNYGSINAEELEVTLDYEHTNDNCHSWPRQEKAVYQLKK